MSPSRPWSLRIFSEATLVVFSVVALAPVVCVLVISAWGDDGGPPLSAYLSVLAESRQWSLLANSLAVAMGTAVVATVLGVAVGFSLEYLRAPTRRVLAYSAAVAFLIPPYVSAIAWIDLLGRRGLLSLYPRDSLGLDPISFNVYSIGGAVLSLSFSYYPVVALATALALRRFDWRLEESALTFGSRARALWSVTLPLCLPGALGGSVVAFSLALVSFSVPSLLQVNVYPVEIHSRFSAFHDFAEGAALCLPLVLIGFAALGLWKIYLRPRSAWLSGARRERGLPVRGFAPVAGAIFCWALVLVTVAGPLLVTLNRSLPLASFGQAWMTAGDEVLTSVVLSAASSTLICGLGLCMAYLGRGRRVGGVYVLSLAPFLVSGPALGLGLIRLWNHAGPASLVYDSFLVVVLAFTARFLAFGHQGLAASLGQLGPRMEEAASTSGVSWSRQFVGIVLPLSSPALIGAWALSFVLCMGELDATTLVAPPGLTTLPARIFTLMHYGPSQTTSALCLLMVAIILASAVMAALCYGLARKVLHERG